jgi:hypothetical protein
MKKVILAFLAVALLLAGGFNLPGFLSHASAAEVVLTSVGQSPDATMVRVVLRRMKINAENQALLRPDGLAGEKVLVAVVGGSSKGLGAAGIDKDQEIERVTGLFQAAKQKGMKLLVMHIGGEGRRGTLSDAFIEAAAPHADRLIVVDGGNNDKIFDRLVEGKDVKILTAPNVNGTADPLKATLSEWGVSAQ